MTADIRNAAEAEAAKRTIEPNVDDPLPIDHHTFGWRRGFAWGAEWAAARVTPTREQIAEAVRLADGEWNFREGTDREDPRTHGTAIADAILALMRELAEGEPVGD